LGLATDRGPDRGARIRTASPKGVKQGRFQSLDLCD
jgi:hypothetical protein